MSRTKKNAEVWTTHPSRTGMQIRSRVEINPEYAVLLEKIIECLKALPEPPDTGRGIPTHHLYDGTARFIMDIRPRSMKGQTQYAKIMRMAQRSREIVGESTTRREIEAVRKAALKLQAVLESLHAPAREALGLNQEPRIGFGTEMQLKLFLVHTEHYELPKLPEKTLRGRKAATAEANFARELAKIFRFHTGKSPTIITPWDGGSPRGPFLEFLTAIFKLLGVEASPLVQARVAIQTMNKIPTKFP